MCHYSYRSAGADSQRSLTATEVTDVSGLSDSRMDCDTDIEDCDGLVMLVRSPNIRSADPRHNDCARTTSATTPSQRGVRPVFAGLR